MNNYITHDDPVPDLTFSSDPGKTEVQISANLYLQGFK